GLGGTTACQRRYYRLSVARLTLYRRCYRLEQAVLPSLTKVARRYYRSRLGGSTAQHTAARRCYR
ncbi:unnamed protein product, partial [Musa textilis]